MPTKKTKRKWIDGEDFYVARRRAGLTPGQAAKMLQVTTRTMRNWENGSSRIPYAAYRLMRLSAGHALINPAWDGWSIWQGVLYSPAGRGFEPYQLTYLSNYLWMARKWLEERSAATKVALAANASHDNSQTFLAAREAKTSAPELDAFVRDEASDATASSGSRLHQSFGSTNRNIAGLQHENPSSQNFGNWYEIRTIADAANDMIHSEVN